MSVQNAEKKESLDPFDMDLVEDEAWMRCCPKIVGLGVMTFCMAWLGFGFGMVLTESKVDKKWLRCYLSDDDGARSSCWMELIYWPGYLWIRVLKLLVIPLMATMVLTLPEKLGKIAPVGLRLICLLTFTSFVASMEGLIWANIFQPGKGVEFAQAGIDDLDHDNYISEFESILNIFTLFFPVNIFEELAESRIIGTISFFLVLGIQVSKGPKVWSDPIFNVGKGVMRATLRILVHVMWFTPIAMFSLIAYNIAKIENIGDVLKALGAYIGTQLWGQFIHLALYFLFFWMTTGRNPFAYFKRISQAPLTALATSSSAATMPVTIRVNKEAGNDDRLVQFTIPLGAGMNMDGTSLGFPIMVLFAAQLIDQKISAGKQITLALLSMVCSLGTAPIPSAGLVFLAMLFLAVDLETSGQELGFALIAVFDWFVDRIETAQNVTSDSFICGILNHYFQGGGGMLGCFMNGMLPEDMGRGGGGSAGGDPEQPTKDTGDEL